jgi:hypothetical protein
MKVFVMTSMQDLAAVNASVMALHCIKEAEQCLNDNHLKHYFTGNKSKECFLVEGGGVGMGMLKLNYMIFDAFICIFIKPTSLVACLEVSEKSHMFLE